MSRTVRVLPWLGEEVPLDEARLELARAEGWIFEELPDGRCLIDAVGNTGDVWLAASLALAVEAACLDVDCCSSE